MLFKWLHFYWIMYPSFNKREIYVVMCFVKCLTLFMILYIYGHMYLWIYYNIIITYEVFYTFITISYMSVCKFTCNVEHTCIMKDNHLYCIYLLKKVITSEFFENEQNVMSQWYTFYAIIYIRYLIILHY